VRNVVSKYFLSLVLNELADSSDLLQVFISACEMEYKIAKLRNDNVDEIHNSILTMLLTVKERYRCKVMENKEQEKLRRAKEREKSLRSGHIRRNCSMEMSKEEKRQYLTEDKNSEQVIKISKALRSRCDHRNRPKVN
jgi:hypothetical protein